jgi:hypothetical protein
VDALSSTSRPSLAEAGINARFFGAYLTFLAGKNGTFATSAATSPASQLSASLSPALNSVDPSSMAAPPLEGEDGAAAAPQPPPLAVPPFTGPIPSAWLTSFQQLWEEEVRSGGGGEAASFGARRFAGDPRAFFEEVAAAMTRVLTLGARFHTRSILLGSGS